MVVITIIAIVVRAITAVALGDSVEPVAGAYDQVSYDALAQRLASGYGFSFPTDWYPFTKADQPTAHWSFLYTIYLAGMYVVFGYHPLLARLVQAVLAGALTPLLTFKLASRLFSPRVGLIAALCSAVYAYFIFYAATLMTESFYIIGLLVSLDLFFRFDRAPTIRNAMLFGLAVGVTALFRQTLLLIVPFAFAGHVLAHRKNMPVPSWVAVFLVICAIVLPWSLRNYLVFDRFLLLNSNSGYAFWSSNHPSQGYDWQADIERVVVPIPEAWKSLNEAELDSRLMNDSVQQIVANPARFGWLIVSKAREQFKFWPDSKSTLISNVSRVFSFGLALPFMLAGLVLSRRHWRKLVPLYLFLVLHNAIFLLSWPAPRYRLATDAVMMLFVAYALVECLMLVRGLTGLTASDRHGATVTGGTS